MASLILPRRLLAIGFQPIQDEAISDLDDEDNRYQVLLISPDRTDCLAKFVLKDTDGNWQTKVYC